MQITELQIRNFKSIGSMKISDVENALILVGKNNTGKTAVLDAIRAVSGVYEIQDEDFQEDYANIEIGVKLLITPEDLRGFHSSGVISSYRRYDAWYRDFCKKLPSYREETEEGEEAENREKTEDREKTEKREGAEGREQAAGGTLAFTFTANRDGKIRYSDGVQKNNTWILKLFPVIYYMDSQRNLKQFQDDVLLLQEDELLKRMRSGCCLFNQAKLCDHCFSCIGLINQKKPEELNAFETAKLLDFKLYQLNLDEFSKKVNKNYRRNGGQDRIVYSMNRDIERMLSVTAEIYSEGKKNPRPVEQLGKGMRSIYMLSLLETYAEGEGQNPGIIIVEEPELFLHPKLQKISGEILYRLSRKNQVIFSTHSPNLLSNFNSRQIRQVVLDDNGCSTVRRHTNISVILDDLGYSANDLMNVDFVFIVEGKQDKSRLPLLLQKYYSEMYDEKGNLSRVAIITTNSCTNIKTYANLKYMNQVYLKDNFLMIRDGDGKDSGMLKRQLCRYYEERNQQDVDHLPRVTEKNVLILKYYSFENYFLNPEIMTQLHIIRSPEEFYEIFLEKWKEYLHKIKSGQRLQEVLGRDLENVEDVRTHMEEIKIHMRGHNLYDIFYGRYKNQETKVLRRYIELAPRDDFRDILEAIDRFIYFENRKR